MIKIIYEISLYNNCVCERDERSAYTKGNSLILEEAWIYIKQKYISCTDKLVFFFFLPVHVTFLKKNLF